MLTAQTSARAAVPPSEWPSINADAAQTGNNASEKTLTARNVLKLKPIWTTPIAAGLSYPIVAGGRIFVPVVLAGRVRVRALDPATGKRTASYSQDAQGGMLYDRGHLYFAGHTLTEVDGVTGKKIAEITGPSHASGSTFLDPVSDRKTIVAGYASQSQTIPNALYAIDPQTNAVLRRIPSASAQATVGAEDILTLMATGSRFYSERTWKLTASQRSLFGDWFIGADLAYTVAAVGRGKATLYAFTAAGRRLWKLPVGPPLVASGWPHAAGPDAINVVTLLPRPGVEAVQPETGKLLWTRPLANVQRLALADNLLFVLTYGLGQPVRIVILRAKTGMPVGTISLPVGYSAFPEINGLVVADGMLFVRAIGPRGEQLLALRP